MRNSSRTIAIAIDHTEGCWLRHIRTFADAHQHLLSTARNGFSLFMVWQTIGIQAGGNAHGEIRSALPFLTVGCQEILVSLVFEDEGQLPGQYVGIGKTGI